MLEVVKQSSYVDRQGGSGRAKLAREIHYLVKTNARQLQERGLRGIVDRHSVSPAESLKWIARGVLDPVLEVFVVVGDSGDAVGSATIQTDVPLRRLRLPFLPAGVQRKIAPLRIDFPFAQPNIHGWLSADFKSGLEEGQAEAVVYTALLDRVKERRTLRTDDPQRLPPQALAWTLEPPSPMMRELANTELAITDIGFYDDCELRGELPVRTCLYVEKVPTKLALDQQYAATCNMLRHGRPNN